MDIEKNYRQSLIEKKERLERINRNLKEEFFGIDDMIDNICRMIRPWYFFPERLSRPLTINLWGMTGVGKTSLVNRLVKLLGVTDRYLHFDMAGNSFEYYLDEDLELFQDNPCILCLDEFQQVRTKDEGSREKSINLSELWELLDTGKLFYRDRYSSSTSDIRIYHEFLNKCLKRGVEVENGKIIAGIDTFIRLGRNTEILNRTDVMDIDISSIEKHFKAFNFDEKGLEQNDFLSHDAVETIYPYHADKFEDIIKFQEYVYTLNGRQIVKLVEKTIYKSLKMLELNLSKSLIFILGNLDEAYGMNNELEPDYNPDMFAEMCSKIGISDINQALQRRFRNEQIARLGNNHVIYPALNNSAFQSIIQNELDLFCRSIENNMGISIHFDSSVNDILFREGVFPAMGVRPLKTTFVNLIESNFSEILCNLQIEHDNINEIDWAFSKERQTFIINARSKDRAKIVLEHPVTLTIENKRTAKKDNLQAVVAVHEAGHAVAYIMQTGLLPVSIKSTSSNNNNHGALETKDGEDIPTFRSIRDRIITSYGGFTAERLIFGEEEYTAGSSQDLEKATGLAAMAIKRYGLGRLKATIGVENPHMIDTVFHQKDTDDEIIELTAQCYRKCENIIKSNMPLLLHLADYLADNPEIKEWQIMEMVNDYAKENFGLVSKSGNTENYNNHRQILKSRYLESILSDEEEQPVSLHPDIKNGRLKIA